MADAFTRPLGVPGIAHNVLPFPHPGGCAGCRSVRCCNYCGADIRADDGRCTNGRCSKCHRDICTPGGVNSPGHGYGGQHNG